MIEPYSAWARLRRYITVGRALPAALVLAALLLTGCANGREAQCRAQGLVPGTAEFLACKNPEKTEELEKAKAAWGRIEHKDHR